MHGVDKVINHYVSKDDKGVRRKTYVNNAVSCCKQCNISKGQASVQDWVERCGRATLALLKVPLES